MQVVVALSCASGGPKSIPESPQFLLDVEEESVASSSRAEVLRYRLVASWLYLRAREPLLVSPVLRVLTNFSSCSIRLLS